MRLARPLTLAIFAPLAMLAVGAGATFGQGTIEGPQWQLVGYRDEGGRSATVPPGIGVTMLLFNDSVFGEAACSDYEGEYVVGKKTLQLFDPTIDTRPCDPAAQRIDDAFYSAFPQIGQFTIDGSALRLRDAAGDPVLTFTEARVPADPTIAPWRLGRIADANGSSGPVIEGSAPSFRFLRGWRLVGSSGCGSFLGSWETRGSLIFITDIAFRHHDCTPDLREQADLILATLDEVTDFTVRPAGLSLEDESRVARLALVPDVPLLERNWTPTALFEADGALRPDTELLLQTSSIRFLKGNEGVSGRTPCRDYSGASERSGLAVTIFDLKREDQACGPSKVRKAEKAFVRALGRVASHALRGSELELLDTSGQPVMQLAAQPGLRDVPWVVTLLDKTPDRPNPKLRMPNAAVTLSADFGESNLLIGQTGRTGFTALYNESGASSVDIFDVSVGRGCGGKKKGTPACLLEARYLRLLKEADGFEMRPNEGQMVLLNGNRDSIVFEPANPDAR